jgi:regulator of protease activity HflC (stomatin/prohibitin superfamily)
METIFASLPIWQILTLGALLSSGTTFLIFVVLVAIKVLRKGEEKYFTDATKPIVMSRGVLEFEFYRESRYVEMTLYCVLMFIFIIIMDSFAYTIGATNLIAVSITNAVLWIVIYMAIGWTEVKPQDFQIVESFGNFKRVITSGPHVLCFPGLIDKPKKFEVSLKKDCHEFFQDESNAGANNMIDFSDGYSIKAKMTLWYLIKNPILWAYRIEENPLKWMEDQLFQTAQALMEQKSLNFATKNKVRIATDTLATHLTIGPTTDSTQNQLEKQLGIKLASFIINDIKIPRKVRNIRMENQRGVADRERRIEEAEGYETAIQKIRKISAAHGHDMTYAEAKQLYDENQNRKVMGSANVTIIGSDITDSLQNIFKR